jgi:hypothetical protein
LFTPLFVLAAINLQLDPPSKTSSLPPPHVTVISAQESDAYSNPTPIAETGLLQVDLATPTQAQFPSTTQSSPELVVPDEPAPEQTFGGRPLPSLQDFVRQVSDGRDGVLTGVYVAGVMALKILQQPDGDASFISAEDGTATQFQSSTFYGVVGLLAHNFLSGRYFRQLNPGQEVTLIYGDGSLENYRISEIANFERLTQGDLRSDFRDLATDIKWTVDEVFNQFYTGDHHLTLQTCIEKDGVWNWGVQFIIAEPQN